ncbi:hypothetical protein MHBO_002508, partial [Bonamia ostreae]
MFAKYKKSGIKVDLKALRKLCSLKTPEANYDVVIVGGGIVGNTLASLLCFYCHSILNICIKFSKITNFAYSIKIPAKSKLTSHLKTLILEKTPNSPKNGGFDVRVYAINHFSRSVFESINAWNFFSGKTPYKKMEIYDCLLKGRLKFIAGELTYNKLDNLGHIVEDKILSNVLSNLNENKTYFLKNDEKTKYLNCEKPNFGQNPPVVKIGNKEINAKLIIGADGANSVVRKAFGFEYNKKEYGKMAVVATVKHEKNKILTCYQRFIDDGPIGILPLNEETSSVVWSTSSQHAQKLLRMADGDFIDELNRFLTVKLSKNAENQPKCISSTFWGELSQVFTNLFPGINDDKSGFPPSMISVVGKRAGFPLSKAICPSTAKKRIVLIGDSAHSIHPLAGQGLNMGIRDAFLLHREIE